MKLLLLFHLMVASPDTITVESVHLNLSSQGVGFEAALHGSGRVGVRAGASYLTFKKPLKLEATTEGHLHVNPNLVSGQVYALADLHLLKNKWLRLTGGVAYAPFQKYEGYIFTEGDVTFGDLTIPHEEFGHVDLEIEWNRVKPYLGLGFGRMHMKNRLGLGMDVGVYHLGSPKLKLNYEGFLETTTVDDELHILENNLRNYRFYPYLSLQVRYKL